MQDIQELKIHFPGKLVFGNGTLQKLPQEILDLGSKKVLLITIEPLLVGLKELIERLKENKIEVLIDTSIVSEPSFKDFEELMDKV